jgi:hypothetical protein
MPGAGLGLPGSPRSESRPRNPSPGTPAPEPQPRNPSTVLARPWWALNHDRGRVRPMRHRNLAGSRDSGLRRLSRLTIRASLLSVVTAFGMATFFAKTAHSETGTSASTATSSTAGQRGASAGRSPAASASHAKASPSPSPSASRRAARTAPAGERLRAHSGGRVFWRATDAAGQRRRLADGGRRGTWIRHRIPRQAGNLGCRVDRPRTGHRCAHR